MLTLHADDVENLRDIPHLRWYGFAIIAQKNHPRQMSAFCGETCQLGLVTIPKRSLNLS